MTKIKVAVLFGGSGSEHDVSCMSVTSVLGNIDREKFDVLMLGITKQGQWLLYEGPIENIIDDSWSVKGPVKPALISVDRTRPGILLIDSGEILPVDAAFPVMHGEFAEDGTMQGLFQLAGIPYVGANVLSSAMCMDKDYTHMLLERIGIPTAKWLTLQRHEPHDTADIDRRITEKLGGYPVFVKPACNGSSVGVTKVKSLADLGPALDLAFAHDRKLLIEEAVVGLEVECAVLGNEEPIASDVLGEIVPEAEFYDYEAKYFDDSTNLYIPARIPEDTTQLIRRTAVLAYRAMSCEGMARVDFFVRANGGIVLNELNTLPGFTHISMYPKLFIASGIPYPELITRLIDLAIARK